MTKVRFYKRVPGQEKALLLETEMTAVPQKGEGVALHIDGPVFTVHDILWLVGWQDGPNTLAMVTLV